MDLTLLPAQPLALRALPRPAAIAAAILRSLGGLVAPGPPRPPAGDLEPDVPEAAGATDTELRLLASAHRRNPDEAIRAAHSTATLLTRWWT